MYLLDTDILSHLWSGNEQVEGRLKEVEDTEIGITSITKSEILRARCENLLKADDSKQLIKAQRRLDRSEGLLAALTIVPFDETAAEEFDRLSAVKKLKKIGRADLLIASITLANSATLVTRNLRHFRQVPDLMIENWLDERS